MIARSANTAAMAVLAVTMLGLALPQSAQARDYGRDSHSYSRQYSDHRDRDYRDDDRGSRYAQSRHRDWGYHRDRYRYRYAPRYYPEVIAYPVAPRMYYPAPYYGGGGYPSEYGTIGIHLDYNLLY